MIVTQFDEDILKPEFLEQLKYAEGASSNPSEKETCNRLMASLQLTSQLSGKKDRCKDRVLHRPVTAMAALGGESNWDLYETTMQRAYPAKTCTTSAVRPKSSRGFRNLYEISGPIGYTTYSDEFCWKPYSKAQPIRSGSSSGIRSNNPHPSNFFRTWKMPRSQNTEDLDSYVPWRKTPSIEEARNAIKAQFSSIYQSDYLGIPQGFQIKHAFSVPPDWKKEVPHNLETEFRSHYQIKPQIPVLKATMKYGYAANVSSPAHGCVPTVIPAHVKNQKNRIQLTTYQKHYGKDYIDLSVLLQCLNQKEVNDYLMTAPEEERKATEHLLKIVHKFKGKSKQSKKSPFSQNITSKCN
ncbi:testis-expressed protein 26 [Microcaecilia unicolor]|uniref:Testis-expressed protein 26 n=1 Tax=Microcaecilia unicolor TaxID=1415580 RepID=A0A6P7XRY5_9AMPH|nr:testis-expressed protein 26 [Microcaecilia unicolor]